MMIDKILFWIGNNGSSKHCPDPDIISLRFVGTIATHHVPEHTHTYIKANENISISQIDWWRLEIWSCIAFRPFVMGVISFVSLSVCRCDLDTLETNKRKPHKYTNKTQ